MNALFKERAAANRVEELRVDDEIAVNIGDWTGGAFRGTPSEVVEAIYKAFNDGGISKQDYFERVGALAGVPVRLWSAETTLVDLHNAGIIDILTINGQRCIT